MFLKCLLLKLLEIDRFHIDEVINVGIAGGLSEELAACDTVAALRIDQWDYDSEALNDPRGYDVSGMTSYADEGLLKTIRAALPDLKEGDMVSGDAFVSREEQKEVIHRYFPTAIACDMEGAAVARAASRAHVPFAVLRTISDMGSDVSYEELKQTACAIAAR